MKSKSRRVNQLRVPAGAVILREGSFSEDALLIISGSVEVRSGKGSRQMLLARLGPGSFVGEMSLVMERPHNATVVALEETVLRPIGRSAFLRLLQRDPAKVFPILRVIFERLRTMNDKYLLLAGHVLQLEEVRGTKREPSSRSPKPAATRTFHARLEGITPQAVGSLGGKPLELKTVPFKIGRADRMDRLDPFAYDDLSLTDKEPFNVSRNHCSINLSGQGRFFIMDRGSRLGTLVNGVRVGGGGLNQLNLSRSNNIIVLGNADSPFQYRVILY